MKRLLVALALVLSLTATSQAFSVYSGYLNSTTEVCHKIEQLKDVILYNYQRSGVLLYAPFYYWTCEGDKGLIYYCYTLAPLGTSDEALLDKVNDAVHDSKVDPVYVPVRIDRAGRKRS
jgi:hypothetical protein